MMKLTLTSDLSQQFTQNNQLRSTTTAKLPSQVTGGDIQAPVQTSLVKSVTFQKREDGADVVSKVDHATILQGDFLNVTLPDNARNAKLLGMLEQLDEEGLKALIDSELLGDDDFLAMAEKLEPEQLQQFADMAQGLKANQFSDSNIGKQFIYQMEVKQLTDKLQGLDEQVLSKVLEKGAELASLVSKATIQEGEGAVYDKQGALDAFVDPSNRDFRNFVSAVVKIDRPEELLQSLSEFSDQQGKNLLALYAKNPQQADDVVNALKDKSEAVKDVFTDQFAKLVRGFYVDQSSHAGRSSKSAESALALQFNAVDTYIQVPKMIDQTLSVIDSYDFSDDQLLEMHSGLQGSVADQQNYLDITQTGMQLLIGEAVGEAKVSLEGKDDALLAIAAIQQSSGANELVSEAKYSQKYLPDLDRSITVEKPPFEAASDTKKAVEMLVAHAYQQVKQLAGNNASVSSVSIADISAQADDLANKILTLGDDKRDALVDDLANKLGPQGPLSERSSELLASSLKDFNNTVAAISNSENIEGLLAAEEATKNVPESDFWRAAAGVKDQVDAFSQILVAVDSNQQQQLVTQVLDALDAVSENKQERSTIGIENLINSHVNE
jgi:hypothetical protein